MTDGAVNCEHDSLNPVAAVSPMVGMWLNCIYGGKGVGMINMLLFIIVGIFVAGQMVGQNARISGQKNWPPRSGPVADRIADPPDYDSVAIWPVCGYRLGQQGHQQSGTARFLANHVSILVVVSQ